MRIVRNAVLRDDKRMQIAMLCTAAFMLLISLCSITVDFSGEAPVFVFEFMNSWAASVSMLPITWAVCTVMLLKTKKSVFSKLPAYIICGIILLALCFYVIASGEDNLVLNLLAFAIAVLLVYPFIIAVLTIEGRVYNRVFAVMFASVLLGISIIAAVVLSVALKCIMLILLIPALVYVELILSVLCYNLEKIKKTED